MRSAVLVAAILASFSEGASVDVKSVISTAKKLRTQAQTRVASLFGSGSGGGDGDSASGECHSDDKEKMGKAFGDAHCSVTDSPIPSAVCTALAETYDNAGQTETDTAFTAQALKLKAGNGLLPSSATVDVEPTAANWATWFAQAPVAGDHGVEALAARLGTLAHGCKDKTWNVAGTSTPAKDPEPSHLMVCQCKMVGDVEATATHGADFCFDNGDVTPEGKCHKVPDSGATTVQLAIRNGDDIGTHVADWKAVGKYWGLKELIKDSCKAEFATKEAATAGSGAILAKAADNLATAWQTNAVTGFATYWDAIAAADITKTGCYFAPAAEA